MFAVSIDELPPLLRASDHGNGSAGSLVNVVPGHRGGRARGAGDGARKKHKRGFRGVKLLKISSATEEAAGFGPLPGQRRDGAQGQSRG